MDKISTFIQKNPVGIAREIGARLKRRRLSKGWTQEELAKRSGVALSTLKLLESSGRGSIQRLIRVAVALGVDGDFRELFSRTDVMESIEAVKLADRKRAPHAKRKGAGDGT
jgi:transcriptional regulator with XRE-family HTH domain